MLQAWAYNLLAEDPNLADEDEWSKATTTDEDVPEDEDEPSEEEGEEAESDKQEPDEWEGAKAEGDKVVVIWSCI
jgi:hypothetical protein